MAQSETVGIQRVYLGGLLRNFMEYGHGRGVRSFPALGSSLWHKLLYDIKLKFPEELSFFLFESGGPFPKSVDLDDVMFGMHFICVERYMDLRASLDPAVAHLQNSVFFFKFFSEPRVQENIIKSMFDVASGVDGFLEY